MQVWLQKNSKRIKLNCSTLNVRHLIGAALLCAFQTWWSSTPTGSWPTLWGTRYGWSPSVIISTSHSWGTTVSPFPFHFQHPALIKVKLIGPFFEQIKWISLSQIWGSFLSHQRCPSWRTRRRCSTPSLCSSSSTSSLSRWAGTLPRASAGFTSTESSRAGWVRDTPSVPTHPMQSDTLRHLHVHVEPRWDCGTRLSRGRLQSRSLIGSCVEALWETRSRGRCGFYCCFFLYDL